MLAVLLGIVSIMTFPIAAKAEPAEKTYTFSELDSPMEYGLKSEITEKGELKITFEDQYKSKFFLIPDDIDPSTITKVTFDVTEGSEAALAFKLHTQEDYDSDNKEGTPVSYGKAEITPSAGKKVKYFSVMSLNAGKTEATIAGVTFSVSGEGNPGADEEETVIEGENIIKNGNFDEADLSMWSAEQGESKITTAEADEAIFGDVKTYGVINSRTRPFDCFGQDVTDVVTNGNTYAFSFYVMLSDDYEGAPADQRQVDFAPYITSGGNTSYLGSYSPELTGTVSQQLTPGKWTRFEGTFKVAAAGDLDQVVIRLLEQGTDYGEGDCVKGEYYVTGVSLIDMNISSASIEKSIPNLRDVAKEDFGDDFIMGTSISGSEINDKVLMELVTKHFNGITLGNELKPDAMFNYSNEKCPGTETVTFNGGSMEVPKMDFSRAEVYLDYLLTWNEEHPDTQIKVRGHVLTWHSQTPEWFFHEDYDASKPYVSPDVMTERHEWYIKSVLEHFVGNDSPYKDLFYGWDVVNEAVSDSTGTYRSDSENSSWWAVYKSNEFIINAFRFANKYAPESLELYYNDYNDTTPGKVQGIAQLLKDVKAADGTRIDGMGMQGHYDADSPKMSEFEEAAKTYGEIVGKIMVTELDFKSSSTYDGTEATLQDEYNKQAYRYRDLYRSMKKLNDEGSVKVDGMIVWGVIDTNSWLQAFTGVGGGVTDGSPQCPLLFDGDYHAKPAFWGIVDPTQLEPQTRSVDICYSSADDFGAAAEYDFADDNSDVTYKAIWNEGRLQFMVNVKDATDDADDRVIVYFDKYNSKTAGIKTKAVEVKRSDAEATDGGYSAIVNVDFEEAAANKVVGFDIVAYDGNSNMAAFNDTSFAQDTGSKFYAEATLKPFVSVPQGTAQIDGEIEDAWNNAVSVSLDNQTDAPEATAEVKLMWDNEYLYALAIVKDPVLNSASEQVHEQDSFEIFIDEKNTKADEYNTATKQYRTNFENANSFNGETCTEENINSATKVTDDGYIVEGAYKWTEISPEVGTYIGLELQINDANASGIRNGTRTWNDTTNQCWSIPACFGTAILTDKAEAGAPAGDGSSIDAANNVVTRSTTGDNKAGVVVGILALLLSAGAVILVKKR